MSFREIAELIGLFALPAMIVGFPLYGLLRRVPVYERFVEGAREGFDVAVRIIPYLVAILFAVAMFRASGALEWCQNALRTPLSWIGVPAELVPMAIVRPLTGSGSLAVLSDMVRQYGPTSELTRMAATIYGASETTFYVIAVYFGAVNIRKTRHAVPVGLIADFAGVLLAVLIIRSMFG
ncbi:MAG TPA: nucleoside recognition domain-containing protein [Tepidisphaeraceae bacterium]|nr:nucleoside recognition domain-containing protein [Tepidisphaeraceae bacterium]